MPCLEIADRLVQVVPAITGLIDRLEKQDLVRRDRSAEDRRVIYIALTDKAKKLLSQIDKPDEDLHKQLIGHLTREELRELSRLLVKARESLSKAT